MQRYPTIIVTTSGTAVLALAFAVGAHFASKDVTLVEPLRIERSEDD